MHQRYLNDICSTLFDEAIEEGKAQQEHCCGENATVCKMIRPHGGFLCNFNLNSGGRESNICSTRNSESINFKINGILFVETNNSLSAKIIVN